MHLEAHTLEAEFQKSQLQKLLPDKAVVDWKSGKVGTFFQFSSKVTEIPVILPPRNLKLPASPVVYKVIAVSKEGINNDVISFYIMQFISFKSIDEISLFSLKDFSGTLKAFDSTAEPHFSLLYFDGIEYTASKGTNLNMKYMMETCTTIVTEHYTDWYNGYTGEYTGTTYNGSTTETFCSEGGGSTGGISGGDGGGGGGYSGDDSGSNDSNTTIIERTEMKLDLKENALEEEDSPSEEEVFNVVVDPSINEYPCLAEVLNATLSSDNDLLKETIGRFISNPKYDLIFKVGECNLTDDACTNGTKVETTGEIFIKIEDTNQNPINFATSILHEGIHAEIFRFVNEHHEGVIDPNDKPQLFEYFQQYAGTKWENDIDHIYMTQNYIIPIAEALREMDNYQYPLNYYKTFAWDGLRKWDPNNSLGITDEEYLQYRNEVTLNFKIKCDD